MVISKDYSLFQRDIARFHVYLAGYMGCSALERNVIATFRQHVHHHVDKVTVGQCRVLAKTLRTLDVMLLLNR